MATSTASPAVARPRRRRFLGLRDVPGRLSLWVFRTPLILYRRGWGSLLGRTFLMFVHVGRKTGRRHEAVAMVLGDDPATRGVVICSGWGPEADWVRNLHVAPAAEIRIGRERFVPVHRFLTEDEAVATVILFRDRHPLRVRLISRILGWGDLGSDHAVRRFVRGHPFVGFRPARLVPPGEVSRTRDGATVAPGSTDSSSIDQPTAHEHMEAMR
jgi:deazaflavin-dependent oxidoreductase (nitroreductase family)